MAGMPNETPRGWHAVDGILQPDRTVGGYLARHEAVKGRCHLRDCRRTCEIDIERLASRGFARMPIDALKRLMRCARMEGCALDFQDEASGGLPITTLLGDVPLDVENREAGVAWVDGYAAFDVSSRAQCLA
jgi:hypothetical protein